MDTRQPYPSDLTNAEWAQARRFVPAPKPGGRPAKHDRREIVNALLYIARTGCQWRALPHDFPPWSTVYNYFKWWKWDGTWGRINDALRIEVGHQLGPERYDGTFDRLMAELRGDLRVTEGRRRQPTAAVLDSQSVKTTEKGGRAATTQPRRSPGASGISSWIPSA